VDHGAAGFARAGAGHASSMTDEELGSYRKVDPAVVDGDPFWSEVRRRHPDVGIVLLRPPATDGPEVRQAPTVPLDVVRTVADEAARTWLRLADLLAGRGATEAPSVRWARSSGDGALLVEKPVPGLGEEGGTELLRDVALRLGAEGWRLHATTLDGRPLLRATNGLLDLRAEAGAGATVLRLATGLMPVADADRAVVRDEVRQEVASWA
jgi:hypothetical protein